MKPLVSADAMRAAEEPLLSQGVDLMSVAAAAVAHHARELTAGTVLVVAGPGNNGGDGLFAAAELASTHRVVAWCPFDARHAAGWEAAEAAGVQLVDQMAALTELADAGLVIDAVFGIGARPGLRGALATFADACLDLAVPVLSVDLPSGLDPDDNQLHASFHATRTVTFHAMKWCHVATPAAERCGEVHVADLGIEHDAGHVWQAEPSDIARCWPVPGVTSDKYSRGVVGLDTGSDQYPGAALLSVAGALYSGAGMVRYTGPVAREWLLGQMPSVVTAQGRVQAAVVGCGWGSGDHTTRYHRALQLGVPLVVDADAIGCADELPENSLLTPHAGELARLLDTDRATVERRPVVAARDAARRLGATVLLKGATQYVVTPTDCYVAVPGPAWTAQAGSGDVLAGICGTLLAAGLPAWQAGVVGASIQALAAPGGPVPPYDAARALPAAIERLTSMRS